MAGVGAGHGRDYRPDLPSRGNNLQGLRRRRGEACTAMTSAAPSELFLSYNSVDREPVRRLEAILAQRGVSTFFDQQSLTPGRPWFDEIENALAAAKAALVFIGHSGLGTIQKREMFIALNRQANDERAGRQFAVVPVMLDGA